MAAGDDSFAPPYNRARIGAMLGRKDEAYHWLEQAIEMGWRYYYQLNMGPNDRLLENLHGDRRFQTMMARVKHEVDSMLVNLVEERVRR